MQKPIPRAQVTALRNRYHAQLVNAEFNLARAREKVAAAEQLVSQLQGAIQGCDAVLEIPPEKPSPEKEAKS